MAKEVLVAVIDGLGGGIGKHIIEKLRANLKDRVEIIALGTNSVATTNMIKAGADVGATGENALAWNCRQADVIVGSLGILLANAMHGEISPAVAAAVSGSPAQKVLIPINRCGAVIAGVSGETLPDLIDDAVRQVEKLL